MVQRERAICNTLFLLSCLFSTACLSVNSAAAVDPVANDAAAIDFVPRDFSGVVWLHTDVSSWSEAATFSNMYVSGNLITLEYDKADTWSGVDLGEGVVVNANPWIFVKQEGVWYGATWEWLRVGQTVKQLKAVNGDHIKKSPLDTFVPVNGEVYGFMVSGLARNSKRNIEARTNVLMYKWGFGVIPACAEPPIIESFAVPTFPYRKGEEGEISYQVSGADRVEITPDVGTVDPEEGTVTIILEESTDVTITAGNYCGEVEETQTVKVTPRYLGYLFRILGDKRQ